MSKPEHIQHSMCMLALTAIEIPFKLYAVEMEEEYNNNLIKSIQAKWFECYNIVKTRRVSQGAIRDLDKLCFPLFKIFDNYNKADNERKFAIWCSSIVLCYHLLLDCKATCPVWYGKGECFETLCNNIEEFAETILFNYEDIGDEGYALYEQYSFKGTIQ